MVDSIRYFAAAWRQILLVSVVAMVLTRGQQLPRQQHQQRQRQQQAITPITNNSCLETNPLGGCDNSACQTQVCEIHDKCCTGEWSQLCVRTATELCTITPLLDEQEDGQQQDTTGNMSNNNTCFERSITPGCSDPLCQDFVCSQDDFCCERQWDVECVAIASQTETLQKYCTHDFPPQANSCFEVEPFLRSNCTTPQSCNDIVCASRERCCAGPYDETCVQVALAECDLPAPTNTCFETSLVPGCTNDDCLQTVCEREPTCCTQPYSDACVDIAKDHGLVCTPPRPTNECFQESPFGGCTDERCASIVCEVSPSCCNDEEVGQWSQLCVRFAESLCQPEIYPRSEDELDVCPFGFTCDDEFMANCTELRMAYRDTFQVGDLWAGSYCGNTGVDGIENCEQGFYCPTPELKIPCPAGFFCPYKTAQPEIVCHQCQEGATKLKRDQFGYVVLTILAVAMVVTLLYGLFKRYNQTLIDRIVAFEKRFVMDRLHTFEERHSRILQYIDQQNQNKYVDRLRPKLELISRRLVSFEARRSSEGSTSEDSLSLVSTSEISAQTFDSRRVFDALDFDCRGDVSFHELNIILGLNELELAEFIRRMNELAGVSTEKDSVSRPVFVRYFLQVLKECSNLTASPEEAEELFDELATHAGEVLADEVHMSRFYTSSMSDFLSDIQICEIIQKFKTIKASAEPALSHKMSNRIAFMAGSGMIKRRRPSIPFQSRSSMSMGSEKSGVFSGDGRDSRMIISRAEFVEFYPQLLLEVTLKNDVLDSFASNEANYPGVDISFVDLNLKVRLGSKSLKVVDGATGRICAKTMTAVMGGSGTGKTSLLNALCGRAFYGETSGEVYVNGHKTSIDDHKDAVGFVPQDDVIYPELTVRENLIYSGRFRLPRGTPEDIIEELADSTLANLGLSRVGDSIVGDVRRRGVSGGERKRVNIGLELMANPSMLFLDEPTSGLDANSALLVMKSLKHLVKTQGVTIVSVIHQPRKFIFDLFDNLILLGRGGRIVYHGPTDSASTYFQDLFYNLPAGESVADWLIDISSGRLEPEVDVAANKDQERQNDADADDHLANEEQETAPLVGERGSGATGPPPIPARSPTHRVATLESIDSSRELMMYIPEIPSKAAFSSDIDPTEGLNEQLHAPPPIPPMSGFISRRLSSVGTPKRPACVMCVQHAIGKTGVTTGKVVQALVEAKDRSTWLSECWRTYFESLNETEINSTYAPPAPYQLPGAVEKPSFFVQLGHQVSRAFLVAWRNRFEKLIDLSIIVIAVILITALDGVAEVTIDEDPEAPFEMVVRPLRDDLETLFTEVFGFSLTRQIQYPLKVGIILCVFLGLAGMKIVTQKRMEFFREAGSGYNLNAYFAAINIIGLVEHSAQVVISAFFCYWIRNPLASGVSFYVNFLLLSWLCISWALLIPMVFPPANVTLVGGFFFMFSGLMFAGAFPPITYSGIYENQFVEIFAGWISPTRYFYEAIAVGEYRCLPEQNGFTIDEGATNRLYNTSLLAIIGYAGNDPSATVKNCGGWYWSAPIALLVGLTIRVLALGAMHGLNRAQQTKKPLRQMLPADLKLFRAVIFYCVFLVGLVAVTTWLMIRDAPFPEKTRDRTDIIADLLFDD